MGKKANPTRPYASAADVEQRLGELLPVHQKRLKEYGYNVNDLRRVCEVDGQADAVDALLAIVTDRSGYEFDTRDLDAATKVAEAVGAEVSPRAHLIRRKKYTPFYGGPRGGTPTSMRGRATTWRDAVAGVGICFGVLVVVGVMVFLVR